LHKNAKRAYPFWKTCKVCSGIFPCLTREQVSRNLTCGSECKGALLSQSKTGVTRGGTVEVICQFCEEPFTVQRWRAQGNRTTKPAKFCSTRCAAQSRCQDEAEIKRMCEIAALGKAGWTEESRRSYRQKMSGENNPAWKGGVTYFDSHGNYPSVKYVRCPPLYQEMARKDGYVAEHRLRVAQALKRCLTSKEVVHHDDHNQRNNDLSNLMLFASNSDHKRYEAHGTPDPIWRGSPHST